MLSNQITDLERESPPKIFYLIDFGPAEANTYSVVQLLTQQAWNYIIPSNPNYSMILCIRCAWETMAPVWDMRHKRLQKVLLSQHPTSSHNVPQWLCCTLKGWWQDCSWWQDCGSISEQSGRRHTCFLTKKRGARLLWLCQLHSCVSWACKEALEHPSDPSTISSPFVPSPGKDGCLCLITAFWGQ